MMTTTIKISILILVVFGWRANCFALDYDPTWEFNVPLANHPDQRDGVDLLIYNTWTGSLNLQADRWGMVSTRHRVKERIFESGASLAGPIIGPVTEI